MKLWSLLGVLVLLVGCSDVKFASKPTNQPAAQAATPVDPDNTYSWSIGSFNMCSVPCGGGSQTRTVECRRQDNVVVPDSNCSTPKPSPTQSCNSNSCSSSYAWNAGPWGECSLTCGGGTRSRSVICQMNNGTTVSDSSCSAGSKPVSSQACNVDSCGSTSYDWQVGTPGSCDCNTQTKTRSVLCKRNDGATAVDSLCTTAKPGVTMACSASEIQSCVGTDTYSWLASDWSNCSASCGGGTQTRNLSCRRNSDQAFVNTAYCTSAAPSTQQSCNTQACSSSTRPVDKTTAITAANNSLDVVLVVDNSMSMLADNLRLAGRMVGFLGKLDTLGVDYQVCVTSTDVNAQNGSPIPWSGLGSFVMNKNTPNKGAIFTNTITAIGANGAGNEQGIKNFNLMVRNHRNSGCFRNQAALTVIGISDEDEASIAGNTSIDPDGTSYQPLDAMNYPSNLVSTVASTFNTSTFTKAFIWNSIIVRPGDVACYNQQQAEDSISVAFYGTFFNQLSSLTGGYVGSICDSDYTQNLNYIANIATNTVSSLTLECSPVGAVTVTTGNNFTTTTNVQGNKIFFNPVLPQAAQWVRLQYNCAN